jgi:hypothetical protein
MISIIHAPFEVNINSSFIPEVIKQRYMKLGDVVTYECQLYTKIKKRNETLERSGKFLCFYVQIEWVYFEVTYGRKESSDTFYS